RVDGRREAAAREADDDAGAGADRRAVGQDVPVVAARDDRVASIEGRERAQRAQRALGHREPVAEPLDSAPHRALEPLAREPAALRGGGDAMARIPRGYGGGEALQARAPLVEHARERAPQPHIELVRALCLLPEHEARMAAAEAVLERREPLRIGAHAPRG